MAASSRVSFTSVLNSAVLCRYVTLFLNPISAAFCFYRIVALVSLTFFSSAAFSGNLEDGLLSFQAGDYKTSRNVLLSIVDQNASDQDIAVAARYLGIMNDLGLGVDVSGEKARIWYGMSADMGDVAAARLLGYLYLDGEVIDRDRRLAKKYFAQSAKLGDEFANIELARMLYEDGEIESAKKHYQFAADKNNYEAQFELAILLLDSDSDTAEAIKWLEKSAQSGNDDALLFLGAIDITENEHPAGYAGGIQSIITAAEWGNVDAMLLLGNLYLDGLLLENSIMEAISWFRKAAVEGSGEAALQLAIIYDDLGDRDESLNFLNSISQFSSPIVLLHAAEFTLGLEYEHNSIPKAMEFFYNAAIQGNLDAQIKYSLSLLDGADVKDAEVADAVEWLHAAAKLGREDAMFYLAMLCFENIRKDCDILEAYNQMKQSAEQGFLSAQLSLAVLYTQGVDVEKNLTSASHWYLTAAEQGSVDAQYNIAIAYLRGLGVEEDIVKSKFWLAEAKQNGDIAAAELLAELVLLLPH